jgi:hypothetical protein
MFVLKSCSVLLDRDSLPLVARASMIKPSLDIIGLIKNEG